MGDGYIVTDENSGEEFIAAIGDCEPLCLTVHPTSLKENDSRCIKVLLVTDTGTGESAYTTQLPEYNQDTEFNLWATALRVTTTIMAHLTGDDGDGTSVR